MCRLKTSWKWLLVWESLTFKILRRGMNCRLDFGDTSIFISHTRSWCCRAPSSPGITFTSVTSLSIVVRKRMKSICMITFPSLYVIRRFSRFLKPAWLHLPTCMMRWLSHFQRSRLNARAYSRSGCWPAIPHPTIHFTVSSTCTAYTAIPISIWNQKLGSWDPGSHSTQMIK